MSKQNESKTDQVNYEVARSMKTLKFNIESAIADYNRRAKFIALMNEVEEDFVYALHQSSENEILGDEIQEFIHKYDN